MIKVLFVCTGNICRSPTAEGLFRHMLEINGLTETIAADSAGTHGYHVGEPPDARSIKAAAARGIDIGAQRARRVRPEDFNAFDMILAMDRGHLAHLKALQPPSTRAEVNLFLDFHPSNKLKDVPDPYYGGENGFEEVLDLAEAACTELIAALRQRVGPST